ncbi:MAG TPA: STAS domain-containing protein [bacterium]|nr:STAS domain-containing protein [bacterium]HNT65683.1 STAS domain-containing protein [bacterium]HOX84842.1 STAS domain-containing protein [bacterium]HPG44292.1 STAS domain-containing protein [bacterium]HPM96659.1 STAS domain-containing protein [bacterium]
MQLKEKIVGDVAILELKGKLMGGPETQEIHSKVKDLADKKQLKVIIDLGKVTWMNSTGLGAMMSSLTTLRNAKGDLKLVRVTDKVKSLFMVTKLITIFDTFDSVEDAIAAFRK